MPGEWCAVLGTTTEDYRSVCALPDTLTMADGTMVSDLFGTTVPPLVDQHGDACIDCEFWTGAVATAPLPTLDRTCNDWSTSEQSGYKGAVGTTQDGYNLTNWPHFSRACHHEFPVVCAQISETTTESPTLAPTRTRITDPNRLCDAFTAWSPCALSSYEPRLCAQFRGAIGCPHPNGVDEAGKVNYTQWRSCASVETCVVPGMGAAVFNR